jgi:phage portal protein BeeE
MQAREGFLLNVGAGNDLELRPVKTKSDQLDSYAGWVYACASTIASDLRANPWAVWKKTGKRREDWEEADKASLPSLFSRPNSTQTWGQFIELRNLHKDLCGEAYWHLICSKPGGAVVGIQLIQPDYVEQPVLDGPRIVGWRVSIGGRSATTIDAQDIIPDFYPHPADPLRGASPVEAFALSHHLDLYMRAYGVKMVRDGSSIAQYLKTEQELTPEQAEASAEQVTARGRRIGRLHVFGKGVSVETPGLPFKELELLDTLKPSQQQIMGIYKVPASKLGIVEDSNRANMEAASYNYNLNALWPRLMTFDEIMNLILMPRVFGKAASGLAYESESPVKEDEQQIFDRALKKFNAGLIKVNQALHEVGADDQGEEGNVYFIPSTVTIVKNLEPTPPKPEPTVSPIAPNNESGGQSPAAPTPQTNQPKQANPIEEATKKIAAAAQVTADAGMRLALDANKREMAVMRRQLAEERYLRMQEQLEARAKSKLRAQFSRDLKETKRLLDEHFAGTRIMRPPAGFPEQLMVLDMGTRNWIDDAAKANHDEWLDLLREITLDGARAGTELLKQEVAGGISFNVFQQKAAEFAARHAAEKISGIQITTERAVRQLITRAVEDGSSLADTSKGLAELYDEFKGSRAETIARTETSTAVSWGKYQAARTSAANLGLTLERQWVATRDDRTRDTHAEADGQTIALNDTYVVGGANLRQPSDPNGPAEETINCRCTETYIDVSD